MRRIERIICGVYWPLLTILLLVSHPAKLVGLRSVPVFPWGKFGVHLTAFALLGFLAQATRWPKRLGGRLILLLMLYAVVTEALQYFVPPRTARVMDAVENFMGIALGTAVYGLLQRRKRQIRAPAWTELPTELAPCVLPAEASAK